MNNMIKSSVMWVAFATMSLNSGADNFIINKEKVTDNIEISLYDNLGSNIFSKEKSKWSMETLKLQWVDHRIVTNAALSYFEEEVKMFKLSQEAKDKITLILYSYLSDHPVLRIWENWKVKFVIDNKKEFAYMVKQFSNVIIDDMPFLIRKVIIPVFFWWNDVLQNKLSNLDWTVMNMKEKQYKDVVFDYLAWIIKRVIVSINWNMKVWDYYNSVVSYYPNKYSGKIMKDLDNLWIKDQEMKNLEYPFK